MSERPVRRVLLMIDYADGDPHNGEVFDLVELVREMAPKTQYGCDLSLKVAVNHDYATKTPDNRPGWKAGISFGGYACGGSMISGATHLDDAVNSIMPDGFRVQDLKKKATKLRKKADQLDHDAAVAKLAQVAEIRHLHPIGRVTEAPAMLRSSGDAVIDTVIPPT